MDNEIYKKLSAPLPKEAIERASKEITRKGYDTTGFQYQYIVDRFNEVIGEKWNFTYKILKEIEGKFASGQTYYDITCDVGIELKEIGVKNCVGGHRAGSYADALKGAITNGFKKTAAFWGVGADAYRGTIDEDYRPVAQDAISARKYAIKLISGVKDENKKTIKNLLDDFDPLLTKKEDYERKC